MPDSTAIRSSVCLSDYELHVVHHVKVAGPRLACEQSLQKPLPSQALRKLFLIKTVLLSLRVFERAQTIYGAAGLPRPLISMQVTTEDLGAPHRAANVFESLRSDGHIIVLLTGQENAVAQVCIDSSSAVLEFANRSASHMTTNQRLDAPALSDQIISSNWKT